MPETYRIPVRLVLKDAIADAERLEKILARLDDVRERNDARRVTATQRAGDREVKAEEQAAERKAKAAERAAERAVKAAEAAAARTAKAEELASQRAVKNEEREADRKVRAAERAHQQMTRAAEREAERATRIAEREAAKLDSIQDQFIRRDYRRRTNYEAMKEREALKAQNRINQSLHGGVGETNLFSGAVSNLAMQFAGLVGTTAIVHGLSNAIQAAKVETTEFARTTLDSKEKLLPLAGVMGESGVSSAFALESAVFGAETGLRVDAANEFRESFRGRAQLAEGLNIDEAGFAQYEKYAATLAAAKKIEADIAGDLFGGVVKAQDFRGAKNPALEAAATANRGFQILDASAGKMPLLAKQAAQLMSFVSENELESSLRKATDVDVLIGTAAETNVKEAFTLASRGVQGLLDTEDEDKAGFFRATGITDKTGALDAVEAANKYLESEVGKGKTVMTALKEAGFKEELERRALSGFFLNRKKVFGPLRDMADAPLDYEGTEAMMGGYLGSEVARRQSGESLLAATEIKAGLEHSGTASLESMAKARLVDREGTKRPWSAVFGTLFGALGDVESFAAEKEAAKMLGVDMKLPGGDSGMPGMLPMQMAADVFGFFSGSQSERITKATGGGLFDAGQSPEERERLIRVLERLDKHLESGAKLRLAPPALAGPPLNQGGAP